MTAFCFLSDADGVVARRHAHGLWKALDSRRQNRLRKEGTDNIIYDAIEDVRGLPLSYTVKNQKAKDGTVWQCIRRGDTLAVPTQNRRRHTAQLPKMHLLMHC